MHSTFNCLEMSNGTDSTISASSIVLIFRIMFFSKYCEAPVGNCSKKPHISSITGITVNKISNNFIGLITSSIIEHWLPAFIRSFLTSRISLPYSHHTEMFTAEYRIRQKKWWIRQIKQKEVGPSYFLLFVCLSACPVWNSHLVSSFLPLIFTFFHLFFLFSHFFTCLYSET